MKMKLQTGKARYKIPAQSQILGVYVDGNQPHNQMCSIMLRQVRLGEIEPSDVRGFPVYFFIIDDTIEFSPVPDKPYVVTVRYVPPIQEF
jgi:hypothetical protein